jgi:hypothetical protein
VESKKKEARGIVHTKIYGTVKYDYSLLNFPLSANHSSAKQTALYVESEVFTIMTMKNAVFWDIKLSSYFTGDTLPLCYRVQPLSAM